MSTTHHTEFLDHQVIDESGDVIGRITDVLFDPESDVPQWAVVKPGRLHRGHYMPLRGAYHTEDGQVVVSHTKHEVAHAPVPSSEHVLTDDDERALREYYG